MHLRRLSMQYNVHETKELAIHLGMQNSTWERLYETIMEEPERLNFETLRRCVDEFNITFNDIRKAIEGGRIQNLHNLCKVSCTVVKICVTRSITCLCYHFTTVNTSCTFYCSQLIVLTGNKSRKMGFGCTYLTTFF